MKSLKNTPDKRRVATLRARLSYSFLGVVVLIGPVALIGCSSGSTTEPPVESATPIAELARSESTETPVPREPSPTPLPPPATPTAEPTATHVSATIAISPTATAGPTPQITATATTTIPTSVNGVPIESIVVMDEATRNNVREIFARGQLLGRDPAAFSKLGDSLIANPYFLTGFDNRPYDLAEYDYLQPVIDHYAGSFERYGVAIKAGLHSWAVFDPIWADKDWCQANESIIECEFRLNNPSILFILLGSNDSGSPGGFDFNIRKIVEFSIEAGVVPVLATKADRFEGPENTNNILIREIAADFKVPLWEFDLLAETIPGRGLQDDGVHLTFFTEYDYNMPEAFQRGHGVHNLTALMVLDAILPEVLGETEVE